MRIKNKEIKNSTIAKPKKNLSLILFLGIAIIMISAGICFGLSKLFATETYYVLSSDVPAKTQITKSLLTPQETAQGTAPQKQYLWTMYNEVMSTVNILFIKEMSLLKVMSGRFQITLTEFLTLGVLPL